MTLYDRRSDQSTYNSLPPSDEPDCAQEDENSADDREDARPLGDRPALSASELKGGAIHAISTGVLRRHPAYSRLNIRPKTEDFFDCLLRENNGDLPEEHAIEVVSNGDGTYTYPDGERRVQAVLRAKGEVVRCRVIEMSGEAMLHRLVTANHRGNQLSPLEIGRSLLLGVKVGVAGHESLTAFAKTVGMKLPNASAVRNAAEVLTSLGDGIDWSPYHPSTKQLACIHKVSDLRTRRMLVERLQAEGWNAARTKTEVDRALGKTVADGPGRPDPFRRVRYGEPIAVSGAGVVLARTEVGRVALKVLRAADGSLQIVMLDPKRAAEGMENGKSEGAPTLPTDGGPDPLDEARRMLNDLRGENAPQVDTETSAAATGVVIGEEASQPAHAAAVEGASSGSILPKGVGGGVAAASMDDGHRRFKTLVEEVLTHDNSRKKKLLEKGNKGLVELGLGAFSTGDPLPRGAGYPGEVVVARYQRRTGGKGAPEVCFAVGKYSPEGVPPVELYNGSELIPIHAEATEGGGWKPLFIGHTCKVAPWTPLIEAAR